MKVTVLVDNNTLIDRYFLAEPGFSLFIEDEGFSLLFDVGYSNIFLSNAAKMGIDIRGIDAVVLSHSHRDHTWGLAPLMRYYAELEMEKRSFKKPGLIAHPLCVTGLSTGDSVDCGDLISVRGIEKFFHMNLSRKPVFLTDRLAFLGEIPRTSDVEGNPILEKKDGDDKTAAVPDDSALAVKTVHGLVIVTGCAHAGISNIVDYAQKVCGDDRIVDIIGGFHLQNPSREQMEGTINYLSGVDIQSIHACHCTDLESKIKLAQITDIKEVGVGLKMEYP